MTKAKGHSVPSQVSMAAEARAHARRGVDGVTRPGSGRDR